jgi:hypothetical protein
LLLFQIKNQEIAARVVEDAAEEVKEAGIDVGSVRYRYQENLGG